MNKNIAILGATGHIAKGLIFNYSRNNHNNLFLFGRSVDKIKNFLNTHALNNSFAGEFAQFGQHRYDVIINCVGAGTPEKVEMMGESIFEINLNFDNLALSYLEKFPETTYIYLSSGVVHLSHLAGYHELTDTDNPDLSLVKPSDYYALTKIFSEKRHRSLKHMNIIDIRIYAYFSRFIDLNSKFLITSLLNCLKDKNTFITNPVNIVRDYVHPEDLYAFVERCLCSGIHNDALDVFSKNPVTKFELLDFFKAKYGLEYSINEAFTVLNPTGDKDEFYPKRTQQVNPGFLPQYTSLEAIAVETEALMRDTGLNKHIINETD